MISTFSKLTLQSLQEKIYKEEVRDQAQRPSGNHPLGKVPRPAQKGNYKPEIMRLNQLFILFNKFILIHSFGTKYEVRCIKNGDVANSNIGHAIKQGNTTSLTPLAQDQNSSLSQSHFIYFNLIPDHFTLGTYAKAPVSTLFL